MMPNPPLPQSSYLATAVPATSGGRRLAQVSPDVLQPRLTPAVMQSHAEGGGSGCAIGAALTTPCIGVGAPPYEQQDHLCYTGMQLSMSADARGG
jgi:hypothetical protein